MTTPWRRGFRRSRPADRRHGPTRPRWCSRTRCSSSPSWSAACWLILRNLPGPLASIAGLLPVGALAEAFGASSVPVGASRSTSGSSPRGAWWPWSAPHGPSAGSEPRADGLMIGVDCLGDRLNDSPDADATLSSTTAKAVPHQRRPWTSEDSSNERGGASMTPSPHRRPPRAAGRGRSPDPPGLGVRARRGPGDTHPSVARSAGSPRPLSVRRLAPPTPRQRVSRPCPTPQAPGHRSRARPDRCTVHP